MITLFFKEAKETALLAKGGVKDLMRDLVVEIKENRVSSIKSQLKDSVKSFVSLSAMRQEDWNAPAKGMQIVSTQSPEYWESLGYSVAGRS